MYEFTEDGALIEVDESAHEGFTIDSDYKAEWAIKKIRNNNDEVERMTALANAEIEAIKDALATSTSGLNHSTEFLANHLRAYFGTVAHKQTATQESYKLLSGSLVMKKPGRKMVKDDEKLLAYFKANDMKDFIKVKEVPAWDAFKKELEYVEIDGETKIVNETTGEVVDAVSIEETPEVFTVKF